MTLEEMMRLLMESGEVEDIQGVSREGPFTILYVDGTRDTNVTLAELEALATVLGPQALSEGSATAQAQPKLSTIPVPGGPGLTEQPDWWDERVDGEWAAQEWDTRKYGQYPFKTNKDGEVTGPDYAAAESQRKRVDAREEEAAPAFKGFETREEAQARADELGEGFDVTYDSKTDTFRVQESTAPRQAEAVTLDGQRFIQEPSGNVEAFPEERRRSLDDMLIDALEAGDLAEQERVLNLMDRVEALRNRPRPMNDAEIFEFLAPIAQNPQHFEELLRAFRQDVGQQVPMVSMSGEGHGQQGPVGVPPGGQPGKVGGQGQIEAIQAEMQALGRTPMTPERDARLQALSGELRALQESQEVERTGALPGFVQAPPQGQGPTASQQWVRGRTGQVMLDPQGSGRFYDPEGHMWEPWEAFQQRMAASAAAQALTPAPTPGSANIPPWQLYAGGYKQEGPMPAEQQALYDAFKQKQQQGPQVQVPGGGNGTTAQPFQGQQLRPPQVGVPNIVTQQPAFGGTEFFPVPTGNVLQEKFTREYNETQQERFKRRRVPQVTFR